MTRFSTCLFAVLGLCAGAFLLPALSQTTEQGQPIPAKPKDLKDALKRIQVVEKQLAEKDAELETIKVAFEKDIKLLRRKIQLLEAERKELIEGLKAEKKEDELKAEKKEDEPKVVLNEAAGNSREIMRLLQQVVSTKELSEKVKLKQALEYFSDALKGKLPMLIDVEAFAAELGPEAANLYEEEVVLPAVPDKMPMSAALHLILSQVGKGQAAYMIRHGYIEIVPAKHVTAARLLAQPVFTSFEQRPLLNVLAELSDLSGLTINIDPGVGKKASSLITANFQNTSVEDTLVAVTEMAELKFVVLRNSAFVTMPGKVEALEEEERQRSKKRQEFPKTPKRLEGATE